MYLLKRDWKVEIDREEVEKTDDITIIDYNVNSFYYYDGLLSLINEIYLNLIKTNVNHGLLSAIAKIVELLNNLNHFCTKLDNLSNEEKLIYDFMSKFDTFKYKNLSEFDMSNNIKIFKAKNITNEEINSIKANFKETLAEDFVDVRDNYLDYYVSDLDDEGFYQIISCTTKTKVISVMENSYNKTILDELLNVFRAISSIKKERMSLDKYYFFEITRNGFHREILYIINKLLLDLNYLFNCSSFRDNEYYIFDEVEIDKRINFDLDKALEHAKNIALNQTSSKF